jgi:hypothetical protein
MVLLIFSTKFKICLAYYGHADVVSMLLRLDSNHTIQNKRGETALDCAKVGQETYGKATDKIAFCPLTVDVVQLREKGYQEGLPGIRVDFYDAEWLAVLGGDYMLARVSKCQQNTVDHTPAQCTSCVRVGVEKRGCLKGFIRGLRDFGWKGLEEIVRIVSIVRVGRCVEHP